MAWKRSGLGARRFCREQGLQSVPSACGARSSRARQLPGRARSS
ncbi:hypothetical protein [Caballeronia arationis]